MKRELASFLRVSITVAVLAEVSWGQSPPILSGCQPARDVQQVLDEQLSSKDLDKMKFSDREARRRARYEELIAKYPGEVELYNRLIEDARGDPIWYPALQERFRMKAAQKSDDPSALYVAGLALFATDTPESIRLLEAAKAKAPQFPWPALVLAWVYSSGARIDKQKSSENLSAFFALCPDSTNEWAQGLLGTDSGLHGARPTEPSRRA